MNRWRACALHLCASALIGASIVATMLAVWYPEPFFHAMGGNELVLILLGVDVVLGPLITLIVFNPRKGGRLLRLDLAVIALVQFAALSYGVHVIAQVRPVYLVFTVDRFDLVSADEIKPQELARVTDPAFASVGWGRPRTVAARSPTEPQEQMRVIQSALAGADLQTFPQHYVPYEALSARALRLSRPVEELRRKRPAEAAAIDEALREAGRRGEDTRYLPLKARARDYCVMLDGASGAVVGFIRVNPW